jgi:drug/metabolite transporter (DMT)-like permease
MADPALTIPASRARRDHVPLGIAFMLAATVTFALSTAISKWQVAHYSFAEVLFLRALGSLPVCALLILPRSGLAVFRTERLRDHVGRSATQAVAQSLIVVALGLMPLAGAVAINFSSPLFATLFAALWLKEKVGLARALALIVGFGGVVLVASPGADSFRSGALFALANAVLFGTVTAGVRGMTTTESAKTLTMYQLLLLTLFYGMTLPFAFRMPAWSDVPLIVANGVTNMLGQYWWTRAIHLAPTSAVVPFQYFSLLWAMMFGFALWGDVPTIGLLVGSAIVVASGLFLIWHESRKKKQAPPSSPAN